MVNVRQAIFSILASTIGYVPSQQPISSTATKSIAIVGAGASGQAMLKNFLDLPLETRKDWEIILYERREHIGGVW